MTSTSCIVLGAPVQEGAGRLGCDMGPSAFRTAGLLTELRNLGYSVEDRGNIVPKPLRDLRHPNPAVKALAETVAWTEAIAEAAYQASGDGMPIFIGGDHSLSAGSMTGVARRATEEGRELFVLWLDSHPDFHTLGTTTSGNLHGVPMAYATGLDGFEGYFPALAAPLKPQNVCMMGIR
ncbi:MAG TPA: arginase family protein, partial [Microvirga sp.]|nr:arginase family protein [Microvirga sp.]